MTYSMAQIETFTGIKAHTLRIWERRYGFLNPMRTETNIRFYSEEELRKLISVGVLVNNGYRVSVIDKMLSEEIHQLAFELLSKSSKDDDNIKSLTLSMLEMNESAFHEIYQRQILRDGVLSTVTNLIYPFLRQIGILWNTNKAIPAQEHFITNLIRQKIVTAIDTIPIADKSKARIVFFLPEYETHEIGLLLSSFIAKDLGWQVYYLGQDVPTEDVITISDDLNPDLLMTMSVTPQLHSFTSNMKLIADETRIPLLISGDIQKLKNIETIKGLKLIQNPEHFIETLNQTVDQ